MMRRPVGTPEYLRGLSHHPSAQSPDTPTSIASPTNIGKSPFLTMSIGGNNNRGNNNGDNNNGGGPTSFLSPPHGSIQRDLLSPTSSQFLVPSLPSMMTPVGASVNASANASATTTTSMHSKLGFQAMNFGNGAIRSPSTSSALRP